MKTNTPHPPKWIDQLLGMLCREEVLEFMQGDLHEMYQMDRSKLGARKANWRYIKNALSVLRPRLLKKAEGGRKLNSFGLFKNHMLSSFRNMRRNALFTAINVVGLATSMAVGITMIVFLTELRAIDSFHINKDHLYRVTTTRKALFEDELEKLATASYYIADQINEKIPEVEELLVMGSRPIEADISTEERGVSLTGYFSTASFFDVFSFHLIKGDPKRVLVDRGAVVLTESAATKLFHNEDPIGKIVQVMGQAGFENGIVTGILKDPPANSYLSFDMLVSMKNNDWLDSAHRSNPDNTFENHVYLTLRKDANENLVNHKLVDLMAQNRSSITHSLEPMKNFITGASRNANGPSFSQARVNMMMVLTFIIIISACFNYTNLSLARAFSRFKEIGVRKVNGASRFQVFSQFLTEAILLAMFAMIIGIGLFFMIKPGFVDQLDSILRHRQVFGLELSLQLLLYFILFAILIGCIAGLFPALILSKLTVNGLFRNAGKIRLLSAINSRQALITIQFALSIGLIMSAVILYKQYTYALNYDLGYETDNILNVRVKGDYLDLIQDEYAKLPEVTKLAPSKIVLGIRWGELSSVISEDFQDTIQCTKNSVGTGYLDLHGFEVLAGSDFKGNGQQNIIVNQHFIRTLGIHDPQEAIGKKVRLWDNAGTTVRIIGVVNDFVGMSLDWPVPEPFVFHQISSATEDVTLGLKLNSNNIRTTIYELERIYQALDPVHTFQADFYSEQISDTYRELNTTYTIVSFLAVLAITVSTLGLLGIAIYSAEIKLKEISIRKVFGADVTDLLLMLSKSFLIMITLAATIGIPVALYFVQRQVLDSFLYTSEIGFLEILSGLFIVSMITLVILGALVSKVIHLNPAHILRDL